MAYYKQGYEEARGNQISVETYRIRRDELKKKHGDLIFTIQAKFEKRKRILQGQIHALNKEMQADIKTEMARFENERKELQKLLAL